MRCQRYDSEYDDDELNDLSEDGHHGGTTRNIGRGAATSDMEEDSSELYGSQQDDDLYEDYQDDGDDYGGYSEDDEFGDEASSDDEEESYRGRPRQGFPSSGRGRGGGRAGRGGGRGPPRRGGPRRRPPPARMQRLKARLVDAQADLKTKMSGVTHKGAKVMRELKVGVRFCRWPPCDTKPTLRVCLASKHALREGGNKRKKWKEKKCSYHRTLPL